MRLHRAMSFGVIECRSMLAALSDEDRVRLLTAAETRAAEREAGLRPSYLVDPIEKDPAIAPKLAEADRLAEAELGSIVWRTGFCHLFWRTKKRMLKERWGIDWRSPAEMNPHMRFD